MSNPTAEFHLKGLLFRSTLAPIVLAWVSHEAEPKENLNLFSVYLGVSRLRV